MQIRTQEKVDIIRDYVEKHPSLPTLTLSKMLYKKHRRLWPNIESCRSSVRTARGNNGEAQRRSSSVKHFHRTPQPAGFVWEFPKSSAPSYDPFVLDCKNTLILSDIHIPFHDTSAVLAAISCGKLRNPDCILLNGDICDFFSMSRFDKNPTESSLKKELDLTRQFLGYLRDMFPKARIIYKLGNHDEWFDKYIFRKCPELYGVEGLNLRHLTTAKIDSIPEVGGIEWVDDQKKVKAGKLSIYHGHEIGKGSIAPPINPARGLFMRTLENGLIGHLHKESKHSERTANGKLISCWSTGCLCGMWPRYARVNKWGHGAAWLQIHNGYFNIELLSILDGRLL